MSNERKCRETILHTHHSNNTISYDLFIQMKIKPGQIWLDDAGIWDGGYEGEMVYIVKSKEPDEEWVLVCFQEWTMGGYIREGFKEKEIKKMKYVGHIKDLRFI